MSVCLFERNKEKERGGERETETERERGKQAIKPAYSTIHLVDDLPAVSVHVSWR